MRMSKRMVVLAMAVALLWPSAGVAPATAADGQGIRERVGKLFGKKDAKSEDEQKKAGQDKKEADEEEADGLDPAVKEAQARDRADGASTGAVVGAVVGDALSDTTKGVVTGALLGGAAGWIAGNVIADKRGEYAKRYAEIDEAIKAADARIAALTADLEAAEARMAVRERRIREAGDERRRTAEAIAAARADGEAIDADIAANKEAVTKARVEIRVLEQNIEELDGVLKEAPDEADAATRRTALVERRAELVSTLNRLNGIDERLADQRRRVRG